MTLAPSGANESSVWRHTQHRHRHGPGTNSSNNTVFVLNGLKFSRPRTQLSHYAGQFAGRMETLHTNKTQGGWGSSHGPRGQGLAARHHSLGPPACSWCTATQAGVDRLCLHSQWGLPGCCGLWSADPRPDACNATCLPASGTRSSPPKTPSETSCRKVPELAQALIGLTQSAPALS